MKNKITGIHRKILPRWLSGKKSACQCRRLGRQVRSLSREDPLEEEMVTYSSILAGKSHGQRSLAGCRLQGHKELGPTQRLSSHTRPHMRCILGLFQVNGNAQLLNDQALREVGTLSKGKCLCASRMPLNVLHCAQSPSRLRL